MDEKQIHAPKETVTPSPSHLRLAHSGPGLRPGQKPGRRKPLFTREEMERVGCAPKKRRTRNQVLVQQVGDLAEATLSARADLCELADVLSGMAAAAHRVGDGEALVSDLLRAIGLAHAARLRLGQGSVEREGP